MTFYKLVQCFDLSLISEATHIHVSDGAFSLLSFPILHPCLHEPISSEAAGEHPAAQACGGR
jgi:hypothetical protein